MKNNRILVCADHYPPNIHGGAEISLKQIIDQLLVLNDHDVIEIVAADTINQDLGRLTIKKLPMTIKFEIFNNIWPINDILLLFWYLHVIKKFKPDIILSQAYSIVPAIIASKFTSKTCITMIRDISPVCPNKTGIRFDLSPCKSFFNLKTCTKCFLHWMSTTSPTTMAGGNELINILKKIIYVMQNVCRTKIGLITLNSNDYNWVASNLFLKIFRKLVRKVLLKNIMPIVDIDCATASTCKNQKIQPREILDLVISVPHHGEFHKGLLFLINDVLPLVKREWRLKVVGTVDPENSNQKIEYFERVSKEKFLNFINECDILLVPSIWYESFGRVVIEGTVSRKRVLVSKNSGAAEFSRLFPNIRVLDLQPVNWASEIEKFEGEDGPTSRVPIENILRDFSIENVALSVDRDLRKISGSKTH